MNRHRIQSLFALILTFTMLCGCSTKTVITNTVTLNTEDAHMEQYTWIGDNIGDFQKVSATEVLRLFDEQGSGIVFFGYPGCKWCERAVPVLNEVIVEKDLMVYYVNTKESIDSNVMSTLKEDLYDALPVDSEGNRDFYVPMVVGIKNGKITGHHTSLVDGFSIQLDSDQMDEAQTKELKNYYYDIIRRTAD